MQPMLLHRPAHSDAEIERAANVLGGDEAQPRGASWFLALAQRPVERIVGAAAWWPPDADGAARFRWNLIHAYAAGETAVTFMEELAAEVASHSALTLRSAVMLPPDSDAARVLEAAGFAKARQNRVFVLPGQESRARALRVGERIWKSKAQELEHAGVRLMPLTQANAEAVWSFIEPYGLMQRHEYVNAVKAGTLRDFSVVLEAGGQVCGAYLCKRVSDEIVSVPVYVVAEDAAIHQDVGSALLVHAYAQRPGCGRVLEMHMRADPVLSPSAPRLYARYGGRQTGALWSYEKKLKP